MRLPPNLPAATALPTLGFTCIYPTAPKRAQFRTETGCFTSELSAEPWRIAEDRTTQLRGSKFNQSKKESPVFDPPKAFPAHVTHRKLGTGFISRSLAGPWKQRLAVFVLDAHAANGQGHCIAASGQGLAIDIDETDAEGPFILEDLSRLPFDQEKELHALELAAMPLERPTGYEMPDRQPETKKTSSAVRSGPLAASLQDFSL